MTRRLIGVHHDGGGRYPRQTLYTADPTALARARAVDPGHVAGVYEYQPDGYANWCATPEQAARLEARRAAP